MLKDAQKVLVIMVVKQAAKALPVQLQELHNYESNYNNNVKYLFVENSSKDETPQLLLHFLQSHDGYFISLGKSQDLELLPRISRIAYARNMAKKFAALFHYDRAVIIDADIYFNSSTLNSLILTSETIDSHFHCGFGTAALIERTSTGYNIITAKHYYDTATFLATQQSQSKWPKCCFQSCLTCKNHEFESDSLPAEGGVISVAYAFGGIAVIHSRIMTDERIIWDPVSINNSPENEHLGFISKMYEHYDFSVTIDLDAKIYWDLSTLSTA